MRAPLLAALLLLPTAALAGEIELPDAADAVVLSLDYEGGYTPPREDAAPYLEVRRDGTVIARDPFRKGDEARDRLDARELAALLRFVVTDQRLLEFDEQAVAKAVGKGKDGIEIMVEDAAVTVVTVALKSRRKTARFHALDLAVRQWPKVDDLARLHAVATRLDQLMQVARAGGKERATKLLARVNEALKKTHADEPPLTLEHLRGVIREPGGKRTLRFVRRAKDRAVQAVVQVPEQGDPTVSISVGE